jgi:hypothetical protein
MRWCEKEYNAKEMNTKSKIVGENGKLKTNKRIHLEECKESILEGSVHWTLKKYQKQVENHDSQQKNDEDRYKFT